MNILKLRLSRLFVACFVALMLFTASCSSLQEKPYWVFDTKQRIISPPLLSGSLVLIQTKDSLFALDANIGKSLWVSSGPVDTTFTVNGAYIVPMKATDDLVVIANGNGPIMTFSINSGKLIWKSQSEADDTDVVSMQIDQDMVYVARYNSRLTAYNLRSGDVIWTNIVPDRTSLRIFLMDNKLYLGTDSSLQVLDSKTGTVLKLISIDDIATAMAVDKNILYLALLHGDSAIAALDLATLNYRWSIPRQVNSSLSDIRSITLDNDTLYTAGAALNAISPLDGKVLWTVDKGDLLGTPVIHSEDLYLAGSKYLYIFNKETGAQKQTIVLPQNFPLSHSIFPQLEPAVVGDKIFIVEGNSLFVFNSLDQSLSPLVSPTSPTK